MNPKPKSTTELHFEMLQAKKIFKPIDTKPAIKSRPFAGTRRESREVLIKHALSSCSKDCWVWERSGKVESMTHSKRCKAEFKETRKALCRYRRKYRHDY